MNKVEVTLSVIVVALFVYIFAFTRQNSSEDKYIKQKHIIDSLKNKITILTKQQSSQDSIINSKQDSLKILDKQIQLKNKEIVNIRLYYGNKIKSISTLTSDELNSFFAERYK